MEKAERIKENILPSVQSTPFKLIGKVMYWIDDDGAEHKIVRACICANGVRDLCIYWKGPKMFDVYLGKIVDVAKERILSIPRGDVLWIRFEPPLASGGRAFYIDIADDPTLKDMVRTILTTFKHGKGADYDMFGGEQYV